MFLGEYQYSLDAKGRVFIPAKLRDELGNSFVITKGIDNCLRVYPISAWESFSEKINEYPDTKARKIRRFVFSAATNNELDSQGRTLISQTLRDYAKISKDIYILGVGAYLEIWDKDTWDKEKENEDLSDIEDLMIDLETNG